MMENQLEEQEKAMKGIRKIDTILDPLKSGMELIKEKLVVFGKIWQLIHTDLNKIERCLELATSSAGARMVCWTKITADVVSHSSKGGLRQFRLYTMHSRMHFTNMRPTFKSGILLSSRIDCPFSSLYGMHVL